MVKEVRIRVSEAQVKHLDIAAEELSVLKKAQRDTFDKLRIKKEQHDTPITGVRSFFSINQDEFNLAIRVFSGLAYSLRERGKAEVLRLYDHSGGRKQLYAFGYRFWDNTRDKIIAPLETHHAVAVTLFGSEHPNGDPIEPISSSVFGFAKSLEKHGKVTLVYQPDELMYYI